MGKTLLVSAGEKRNLFTQPRVSCSLRRKLCLQEKKKTFCINALRDSWAAAVFEAPSKTPWWAAVTRGGSGSARPAAVLKGGSTKGRLSHVFFYLKFGRTDERGRNRSHLWFHLLAAEVAIPTHPT